MQQVEDIRRTKYYDYAVFLDVSREEVLRRLLARLEQMIRRNYKQQLELYKKETGPVVEYFRKKDNFISVTAEGGTPEETAKEIIRRIDNGGQ